MFLCDYQCNNYVQCLFVTFKNRQSLVNFDRQTTFIITTFGEILIYDIFKTIVSIVLYFMMLKLSSILYYYYFLLLFKISIIIIIIFFII